MGGLDGGRKLAIASMLLAGCQRLDYVDEDEDEVRLDDSSGDVAVSGASSDDGAPTPRPVCVYRTWCECYSDDEFCDSVTGIASCGSVAECDELADEDARAACLVGYYCDEGGSLEGDDVSCNDAPDECAGTCDLDPAECDEDGDGVLTFQCGYGAFECRSDQFCVELSELWNCDANCSNCTPSGGGFECVDLPAECEADTLEGQRNCIREAFCAVPEIFGNGRQVQCADDECHG